MKLSIKIIFLALVKVNAVHAGETCQRALLSSDPSQVRYVFIGGGSKRLFLSTPLGQVQGQIVDSLPAGVDPIFIHNALFAKRVSRFDLFVKGSAWVRDWLPRIVLDDQGRPFLLNFEPSALEEAEIGLRAMQKKFALPTQTIKAFFDWGNVIIDEQGTLISSFSKLLAQINQTHYKLNELQLKERIAAGLQVRRAIWLPELPGEPTGHVDMFVSYLGKGNVIVADSRDKERAAVLSQVADILGNAGYKVHRIFNAGSDNRGLNLTYTNALIVNGRALVPVYAHYMAEYWRLTKPQRVFWNLVETFFKVKFASALAKRSKAESEEGFADDVAAVNLYRSLGFEVYPIFMNETVDLKGMVHCLTVCLPTEVAETLEQWLKK